MMIRVFTISWMSLLLVTVTAAAQSQKIGYIDSERILEQMPEYTGIEQRLSILSDSWHEELNRMDREVGELRETFEAREILFTDEMREAHLSQIESLERERERFLQDKFGPDGEYFTRQRDLLEPLQRQVFDAVNRVAQQEEFDFIFDRSHDVRFLYAGSQWNVTNQVLEVLGLESDREASLRN